MENQEYEKIIKLIQGKIIVKDQEELSKLKKKYEKYEEKHGRLYKKNKEGKILKVLKKDEVDSILWITHNHPTGGHFGIENTYEKN